MIYDSILDAYYGEEFVKIDGLDEAVIGVEETNMQLIYSVKKILHILQERDLMTPEESLEFFDYNISSLFLGSQTPIFCQDYFE